MPTQSPICFLTFGSCLAAGNDLSCLVTCLRKAAGKLNDGELEPKPSGSRKLGAPLLQREPPQLGSPVFCVGIAGPVLPGFVSEEFRNLDFVQDLPVSH